MVLGYARDAWGWAGVWTGSVRTGQGGATGYTGNEGGGGRDAVGWLWGQVRIGQGKR